MPRCEPITLKRLARLSGYGYNPHYRRAVAELVERGFLERTTHGVRRKSEAAGHGSPTLNDIAERWAAR